MKVKDKIILMVLCLSMLWAVPAWAADQLAKGVQYRSFERNNWEGKPIKGHILEVDPGVKYTEIRPVMGNEVFGQRENLSKMAQRTGAIAAVNGGFFDMGSGVPLGNLIIDGKPEYISDILKTSFGFKTSGGLKLGYLAPKITVELTGSSLLTTKGINVPAVNDGFVLYTHAWGKEVYASNCVVLKPTQNGFKAYAAAGGVKAPAGGYVLAGWGSSAGQLVGVAEGTKARVITEMPEDWQNIRHVLTGSPMLVEGGLPVDQAVNEGLWGSVLKYSPRTALGVTAQGKVLLVVVDGRQESSAGLTLEEMAYLMIDLGAVQAVGLDGGGSSEMWVKGKIVNNPSDKKERSLANGLIILQQMPVYVNYQRLYLDVAPVLDNGRTLVPMRKIFERLGADIDWNAQSQTVTATKGEVKIELTLGKTTAVVNGKNIKLDVPAKLVDGRTMVPMRFVGETLGAKVNYVTTNGPAVHIISPEGGTADEQ
ncbi:copper amine oxidase domain protein [Desulforamulus reducens MI-1]|uniref:Copper amine oxidase domain protein n=1 Tax=Desulforamulus reducens (strain ATCC BAA-1160 / DSM 100696 / MI-1) TaxID=349161 RepID=A4J956_DESRM|nr:phosphodiester glycosidase family protein [Desulforamulus reducens]ABO51609.1 copper amine oxidase domain protein [Desulforamulus reducens MI-1]